MEMALRPVTPLAVVLRIIVALVVGGILGIERGLKNRPAGMRTYMLVCLGSCLIMMTNQFVFQFVGGGDPMRLGAQVVSGIGFLGAGTIVVTRRNHIKGLTTAAGLWASAAVGLAIGVGFYEGALMAGLSVFLILTVMHRWDMSMRSRTRNLDLYIEIAEGLGIGSLIRQLRALDVDIEEVQLEHDISVEEGIRAVLVTLKTSHRVNHEEFLQKIRQIKGILLLEEL